MQQDASRSEMRDAQQPQAASSIVELSALTGGLAHEIRNSLSTLTVNLQLLDEDWRAMEASTDDDAELARESLDVARRSRARLGTLLVEARRLESILNDFLQFVNRRELSLSGVDLTRLVQDVAEFFRPRAEANDIAMAVQAPGQPLWCRADVNLIKQAMLNLLINAQQAMENGGRLDIRMSSDGRHARIEVQDTGTGIAPENLSRVFEAYFSTRKAGTGLGLATTRRIVEEHGGRVDVHSAPGQGTSITIELPLHED